MNLQNKLRSDYEHTLVHDRFGMAFVARLSDAADALPNDISERLRVARAQALVKRKLVLAVNKASHTAAAIVGNGSSATLGQGDDNFGPWGRFTAALPLLALVVGLVSIHFIQNERRANEIAEIDSALLIDDLPPAAYTDPGFVQFLKAKRDLQQ